MTRFTVAVLPDAAAELREAFLWYFDKGPLAADAFGAVAEATLTACKWLLPTGPRMRTAFTSITSGTSHTRCDMRSLERK